MDPMLIIAGYASLGLVYFALYRFVFHRFFKWKMIHAIWLPIAVAIFGVFTVVSILMIDDPSAWTDLGAIIAGMVIFPPVILFFIAYFVDRAMRKSR